MDQTLREVAQQLAQGSGGTVNKVVKALAASKLSKKLGRRERELSNEEIKRLEKFLDEEQSQTKVPTSTDRGSFKDIVDPVVDMVAESISSSELRFVEYLKSQSNDSQFRYIPQKHDGMLLSLARNSIGRLLTKDEKHEIRKMLLKKLI